jgi:hypothetical protein
MADEKEWQKQLETGLQRVQDALAKDARPHAQLLQAVIAAASARALEKINEGVARGEERRQLREARKQERWERRQRQRERRAEGDPRAALPAGVVFAAFAGIALYFGLTEAHFFWMMFVAFGFAMAAAGIVGKALTAGPRPKQLPEDGVQAPQASAQPAGQPAAETSAVDGRLARVDAICAKILAAIQGGSEAVREIVHKPEQTLKALSATCRELARRERELRAAVTDEDERRLHGERDALSARIAAEKDAVARGRLDSALRALDAQLAQRAELATSASRLEAEGTRILYTLENLHTQVLRARSADAASADVAGAGLRRSLEQIGEEIDAVAQALEQAHGAELVQPVQEIGSDPTALRPPANRERN